MELIIMGQRVRIHKIKRKDGKAKGRMVKRRRRP